MSRAQRTEQSEGRGAASSVAAEGVCIQRLPCQSRYRRRTLPLQPRLKSCASRVSLAKRVDPRVRRGIPLAPNGCSRPSTTGPRTPLWPGGSHHILRYRLQRSALNGKTAHGACTRRRLPAGGWDGQPTTTQAVDATYRVTIQRVSELDPEHGGQRISGTMMTDAYVQLRMRLGMANLIRDGPTPRELDEAKAAERARIAHWMSRLGWQESRTELIGEGVVFDDDPNLYRRVLASQLEATRDVVRSVASRQLSGPGFTLVARGRAIP